MLEGAGFEAGSQTVILGSAIIAGFCAAACSLPFDFVKTRVQKMEPGPDGKYPYAGPGDCALKTLRNEGFLKFYTGFPTYCVRLTPPPSPPLPDWMLPNTRPCLCFYYTSQILSYVLLKPLPTRPKS